jgi:hypothetical protein
MRQVLSAMSFSITPDVTPFFDADTSTVCYVVNDPASRACAVFDSVMNFDYAAARIGYLSADAIIGHIAGAA